MSNMTTEEIAIYLTDRVALAIREAEIGGPLSTSLEETESAAHWRLLALAAIKAMLTSGMVYVDVEHE
jgi:hypothetical protein